jgi:RNase P subunit RPR2
MGEDRFDAQWRTLAEEALTGMAEWRLQHPTATFREIESAVDERLARLRARMLQDAALASAARDLRDVPAAARPACPTCHQALQARGRKTRRLTTNDAQPIELSRTYAACPACGAGLFPPG